MQPVSQILKQHLPSLSNEEKFVVQIGESARINEYDHLELSAEVDGQKLKGRKLALAHIGGVLIKVWKFIGLKKEKWPDAEASSLLSLFVYDTFGYLVPEEIYKAFYYAIQKKFEIPGREDTGVKHWQVFDAQLLSDVLFAYITYMKKSRDKVSYLLDSHDSAVHELSRRRERRQKDHEAVIRSLDVVQEELRGEAQEILTKSLLTPSIYKWLVHIRAIPWDQALFDSVFRQVLEHMRSGTYAKVYDRTCQEVAAHYITEICKDGKDLLEDFRMEGVGLSVSYLGKW